MAILLPPMHTHSAYWLWAQVCVFCSDSSTVVFITHCSTSGMWNIYYTSMPTFSGFYLLAKVEEAADKPIYKWTHHFVSGHTLKHLCAATVPVFLTLMIAKRSIEAERFFLLTVFSSNMQLSRIMIRDGVGIDQVRFNFC